MASFFKKRRYCFKPSLILCSALLLVSHFSYADTIRVYAAASLSNAMNDILKSYQGQSAQRKIVTSYAASSALAKQIKAGARADLYLSADQDWMHYLVKQKVIHANQVQPLLSNQLVLVTQPHQQIAFRPQSNFNFAASFQGHLCTGQMQSVPAGKYAKQSLSQLQWLKSLKGRVVETDDVRAALLFVERGECTLGIVYRSDALISRKVKVVGRFPTQLHQAIVYPIALTKSGEANAEAVKFKTFITQSPQAKAIFKKYGFGLL